MLPNIDKSSLGDQEKEETRVFFAKMKGDYYRYMAEALSDTKRTVSKRGVGVHRLNLSRTLRLRRESEKGLRRGL